MTIKYFTIYGERCSGTNFLEYAIQKNFNLEFTKKYGLKHFFGFYNFNKDNAEDTLFIGIVREPISWINSLYEKKHHIPEKNLININAFLFNEFYSLYGCGKEIQEDRHMKTKQRYKNIFEMRITKNYFLINEMKNKVKNYILINYEDLRDNYDKTLDNIKNKFKLKKVQSNYIKISNYKGYGGEKFKIKEISLTNDIIKIIKNNLNKEQEKKLGYIL